MSLLQLGCASDGAVMMAGPDCRCHRVSVTSVFPMGAEGVWDMRACCACCNATLSRTCKPDRDRAPVVKAGHWVNCGLGFYGLHTTRSTVLKIHRAYVPDLAARQSARSDVSRPEIQAQQWLDSERPRVLGIDLEDGEPPHVP